MTALARGTRDHTGLWAEAGRHTQDRAWMQLYTDFIRLCRAVDFIYSHATGKRLKMAP